MGLIKELRGKIDEYINKYNNNDEVFKRIKEDYKDNKFVLITRDYQEPEKVIEGKELVIECLFNDDRNVLYYYFSVYIRINKDDFIWICFSDDNINLYKGDYAYILVIGWYYNGFVNYIKENKDENIFLNLIYEIIYTTPELNNEYTRDKHLILLEEIMKNIGEKI